MQINPPVHEVSRPRQHPPSADERLNPCLKEQKLTYKCLHENDFDNERCQLFFDNYKACKSFWNFVKKDRAGKKITPSLPEPADRQRVKQEYMQNNWSS